MEAGRGASTVAFDGTTLAVAAYGDAGEPLVLVHSGWEDRRAWELVVPGLAGALSTLTYDRRGHGESTGPVRRRPVEDDAQDLAQLLERADVFPAHLAALGTAASSVLRLAGERPELVRSVLLHEPLLDVAPGPGTGDEPGRAGLISAVRRAAALAGAGRPELAAQSYLGDFGSAGERWDRLPPDSRRRWVRNAPAWKDEVDAPDGLSIPREWLDQVGVPVFVTYGEGSPAILRQAEERLVAALPGGSLHELPRAGHLPHLFVPEALAATWVGFLLERNVPPT